MQRHQAAKRRQTDHAANEHVDVDEDGRPLHKEVVLKKIRRADIRW